MVKRVEILVADSRLLIACSRLLIARAWWVSARSEVYAYPLTCTMQLSDCLDLVALENELDRQIVVDGSKVTDLFLLQYLLHWIPRSELNMPSANDIQDID